MKRTLKSYSRVYLSCLLLWRCTTGNVLYGGPIGKRIQIWPRSFMEARFRNFFFLFIMCASINSGAYLILLGRQWDERRENFFPLELLAGHYFPFPPAYERNFLFSSLSSRSTAHDSFLARSHANKRRIKRNRLPLIITSHVIWAAIMSGRTVPCGGRRENNSARGKR